MLFGRKHKNPIKIADKGVVEWKYTTCGYCSTGCSIEVGLDRSGTAVASRGAADFADKLLSAMREQFGVSPVVTAR